MKWFAYVYDPENLFDRALFEKEFEYVFITNNIVSVISDVYHTYKGCDHFCLIYDGHWIFDGPANQAFWTVRYKNDSILNHHTAGLIDYNSKLEYNKENALALQEEIIACWKSIF
jgi:hypothetical protein